MRKLFILFGILFLAACGGIAAAEYTTVDAVVQVNEVTPAPEPVIIAEPAGFTFAFRDTVIYMNQNMADVIADIGEPLSVHETPSCAFDGFDRIFIFPGVQFHTYPVGDENFVQIISFWDDIVSTREGISHGAEWARVVSVYGADYVQEHSMYTFTQDGTTLSFFVDNGVVVQITYALIMD